MIRQFKILFVLSGIIIFNCAGPRYVMTPEAQSIRDSIDQLTGVKQMKLMEGTEYETPAFFFEGNLPGPHIIIVGGTHGNEPAGYESALRLLDRFRTSGPTRGSIILIPIANRVSVTNYERRIPVPDGMDRERGNLNRCYPGKPEGYPMEQLAYQIQQLAIRNQVEVFIDLHEARTPHLETDTESEERGLGQTIIYHPNEASTWLLMVLLDQINQEISNLENRFSGLERPVKNSAAWWAGQYLDCAAFTFETSRSLPLPQRIRYQLDLVDIVLKEKGLF